MKSYGLNPAAPQGSDQRQDAMSSRHPMYTQLSPWSNLLSPDTKQGVGNLLVAHTTQGPMLTQNRPSINTRQPRLIQAGKPDNPRPLDLSHISSIQIAWLLGASVFGLMGFSRKPC
ncbi:hypothetical protein [Desulfoplanes formicivorans]|uniref:hypothetical protein n=1 Tax=Desulfoplanes formicivorans TaxID=1592317 RepID=UPI00114C884C|nr:hypothetical protein [Desulfoplanes formicivorans]